MRIGRYAVRGLLGRGGMGTVYKVVQPVTGRIAALKLLRPTDMLEDIAGFETLATAFKNEAVLMAGLEHPNIATVWDYDVALVAGRERPFFVMDYCSLTLGAIIGETYRVEAPSRRLPLERAVGYALQTLGALDCLHQAGVIHRDVKPFNIMISGHDEVRLIDFGLSRLRGEMRAAHQSGSGLPGSVKIGSPYYAAPEQERTPDAVDGRADLYPVGVMLFRMLTGLLPYLDPDDRASAGQRLARSEAFQLSGPDSPDGPDWENEVDGGGPLRASRLCAELAADTAHGGAWDAFFATAMAEHPENRFADAAEMAGELAELLRCWKKRVRSTCVLQEATVASQDKSATQPGLQVSQAGGDYPRRISCRQGIRGAQERFGLDVLWRPTRNAVPLLVDKGNGTVLDVRSGCLWQRAANTRALSWQDAQAYAEARNAEGFAGYTDWRLPTVDELCSLLERRSVADAYCLPPMLDGVRGAGTDTLLDGELGSAFALRRGHDIFWTCDRKSYMAAWFVNASMGFVGWQDDTCRFGVRVVRAL